MPISGGRGTSGSGARVVKGHGWFRGTSGGCRLGPLAWGPRLTPSHAPKHGARARVEGCKAMRRP